MPKAKPPISMGMAKNKSTPAEWDELKNSTAKFTTDMKTGYVRSCCSGRGLSLEDAI